MRVRDRLREAESFIHMAKNRAADVPPELREAVPELTAALADLEACEARLQAARATLQRLARADACHGAADAPGASSS